MAIWVTYLNPPFNLAPSRQQRLMPNQISRGGIGASRSQTVTGTAFLFPGQGALLGIEARVGQIVINRRSKLLIRSGHSHSSKRDQLHQVMVVCETAYRLPPGPLVVGIETGKDHGLAVRNPTKKKGRTRIHADCAPCQQSRQSGKILGSHVPA